MDFWKKKKLNAHPPVRCTLHVFLHQRIYDTSLGSWDIAMWRFLWRRGRAEQELGILAVGLNLFKAAHIGAAL